MTNREAFCEEHANAFLSKTTDEKPDDEGYFGVGPDFFITSKKGQGATTVSGLAMLQAIVDETVKMNKKLDYSGGNAMGARNLITKKALTSSQTHVLVVWGLHQGQQVKKDGSKGTHFTVSEIISGAGQNAVTKTWHLYVTTDGKRLCGASDGPASATAIKKY
jgi:hypothetical protein